MRVRQGWVVEHFGGGEGISRSLGLVDRLRVQQAHVL